MLKKFDVDKSISVFGARENNLQNIDIQIPRNKLVVFTGRSGSGKSSLAFNTIHAEANRRYLETFGSYARYFVGDISRPDVDKIEGLSPVVAIEQKSTNKNPRSTVGTLTEIYDYIRLLFARVGQPYSYVTGKKMVKYSEQNIIDLVKKNFNNKKLKILSPLIKSRKGIYQDLFQNLIKKGFIWARVDSNIIRMSNDLRLDRYKIHDIELVVDEFVLNDNNKKRLTLSIKTAVENGKGVCMIIDENENFKYYSTKMMCPESAIAYQDPEPNTFSFNSPKGACKSCNGIGQKFEVDLKKIIPDDSKSINQNGIQALDISKNNFTTKQIKQIANLYEIDLNTPIKNIRKDHLNIILNGVSGEHTKEYKHSKVSSKIFLDFPGIIGLIYEQFNFPLSNSLKRWSKKFMKSIDCESCNGTRLNEQASSYKVLDYSINDIVNLPISEMNQVLQKIYENFDENQKVISKLIISEIKKRVKFINDVGLGYLNLSRRSKSLSGGEAQRIRLATQIGTQLTNVLYILDEPSIGLHQRDNFKLITSLKKLRDIGNSIIVVEHDKEMIISSDYVVEIGPDAGIEGGKIVSICRPEELKGNNNLTAQYINKQKNIDIPKKRKIDFKKTIELTGATGNNLKGVDVIIPLEVFCCITGVSGSGKSTLINETLHPILSEKLHRGEKIPLPYENVKGIEHLDRVISVDQSPIGKTPRSNPATYVGFFSEIRELFSKTQLSRERGYGPGRFSFNVSGGRCEECKGAGIKNIEMNFLPDVSVLCSSCNGKRYNKEILDVKLKGKNISEILEMNLDEALIFFSSFPKIKNKIFTLCEIGLGYLKIGQQSTTLSGGEAQRIKLASELCKKNQKRTLFLLDEPTTGLHFDDIKMLLGIIERLVNQKNTVLVIEHNLDVIKVADYIIDLGPEGGKNGGNILFSGPPEEAIKLKNNSTAKYLSDEFKQSY